MLVVTAKGAKASLPTRTARSEAPLAIGGGGSADEGRLLEISAPITKDELSANGQQPTGWRVSSEANHYTAYVICTGVAATEPPEEESEEEKKAAAEKEAAEATPK